MGRTMLDVLVLKSPSTHGSAPAIHGSESFQDLLGRLDTFFVILLQAAHDDRLESGRYIWTEGLQATRLGVHMVIEDLTFNERRLAGQEVEDGASEGIDIGAIVDGLSENLLRDI